MATQNPVLYNMGLQQGRSTGAFRGVRATPKLNTGAEQFRALSQQYNTDMLAAMEGSGERKVAYDALMSELGASLTSAKSAFEAKLPGLEQNVRTAGEAYQNYSPPTDLTGTVRLTANNVFQADEATVRRNLYAAQHDYPKLAPIYQAALDEIMAKKAESITPYKTAYETASSAIKTEADAYNKLVADANTRSKTAYETYAGAADQVRAKYEADRNAMTGLGHLAYAGPDETTASPSPTTAQQLGATDLYSQDLEAQVLGRKQRMQEAPEEDIMSGVLQSSLYRR